MKILFICRANVGRSQMAELILNSLSKEHTAKSAGISPGKWEGKTLHETKYVLPVLKEIGLNAEEGLSKKITLSLVNWADKIIVIGADKATWPDYLSNYNDVVYWDVDDPAHKDIIAHRKARDEIKENVIKLLKEIS